MSGSHLRSEHEKIIIRAVSGNPGFQPHFVSKERWSLISDSSLEYELERRVLEVF